MGKCCRALDIESEKLFNRQNYLFIEQQACIVALEVEADVTIQIWSIRCKNKILYVGVVRLHPIRIRYGIVFFAA